jgi:hypothetical protein
MIESTQFSTFPETAKGGLLICGMNWGGKPEVPDRGVETESRPWAPWFSHPQNRSRGFQATLLKWFELWGYPLSHENPTHLDIAIAQSNIFFDKSPRFLAMPKRERWIRGVTRLAEAVETMDFSGVLLVSTTVVNWVISLSEANEVPKWNQVVGNGEWDSPRYSRLNLRFRQGQRHVAGVSHPSRGVAHADVRAAATAMQPWIARVLSAHERKSQARQRTVSAPPSDRDP